jgi:hypothetical protein
VLLTAAAVTAIVSAIVFAPASAPAPVRAQGPTPAVLPAQITGNLVLDCGFGACQGDGVSFTPLVVPSDAIADLNARRIVQGVAEPGWTLLEARAKAQVAAMHGVANDDRLLVGARNDIRAAMYQQLFAIKLKEETSGFFSLDAEERLISEAYFQRLRTMRTRAADAAIGQYDRWASNPCTYAFPAGTPLDPYRNPGCNQLGGIVAGADSFPPTFEQFQAAGAAIAYGDTIPPGLQPLFSDFNTKLAVLIGVAGLSLAGIAFGLAAAAVPAIAATAALAMGSTVAIALTTGISGVTTGATATFGSAAGAAALSGIGIGAVVSVVAAVIIGVIVVGIRTWQVIEALGLRDRLVEARDLAAAGRSDDEGDDWRSPEGQIEMLAVVMSQTLPDFQEAAYQGSTPFEWRPDIDRSFAVANQPGTSLGNLPTIEAIDWAGRLQRVTMVDGWFVVEKQRTLAGISQTTREWALSFEYVDWEGTLRTASINRDRFILSDKLDAPTTAGTNAGIPRTEISATLDYQAPGGTPLRAVSRGNQPPLLKAEVQGTLVEGDTVTFRAISSDPDSDAVSVTWSVQPTYQQVGLNVSERACVNGVFAEPGITWTCPWRVFSGDTVQFPYLNDGRYLVRVVATDAFGATTTQWLSFDIADAAPTMADLDVTPTQVREGEAVVLTGTLSDAGDDWYDITVDWGDGSTTTRQVGENIIGEGTGQQPRGGQDDLPFSFEHTYTDDPVGPDNTYDIEITVTGRRPGGISTITARSTTATIPVTVVDAAPTSVRRPATGAIDEGQRASATGYVDSSDPFRVVIDWGDGAVDELRFPCTDGEPCAFGKERTIPREASNDTFICRPDPASPTTCAGWFFDADHPYADDPKGDAVAYTTSVTVIDDDDRRETSTASLVVRNLAPVIDFNRSRPCTPGTICIPTPDPDTTAVTRGEAVRVRGSVVDVPADAVTVTIDWGDGTVEQVPLEAQSWGGACTLLRPCDPIPDFFDETHVYAVAGTYEVTATADDGDGGIGQARVTTVVEPIPGLVLADTPASAAEGAGPVSFRAALERRPTATVTVTPVATGACTVSGPLTFTSADFDTPRSITVTPVDDAAVGSQPCRIELTSSSDDPGYQGLTAAFDLDIVDDDDSTIRLDISPENLSESAATVVTAEVSGGAGPTTGSVLFTVESFALGFTVPVVDGRAVVDLGLLPRGGYLVTAAYTGDSQYSPADVSQRVVVTAVPAPVDDDYAIEEDAPVTTFDVLANDLDADGDTLRIVANTAPRLGVVTCSTTVCTYRPNPNANGPDSFTYTVSDGIFTKVATVRLTVTPVDDAPVVTPPPAVIRVAGGGTTTIDVLEGVVDPDGDDMVVVSFTQPSHGSVTCTPAGRCEYTPDVGYSGPDSFTVTVGTSATGLMSGLVGALALERPTIELRIRLDVVGQPAGGGTLPESPSGGPPPSVPVGQPAGGGTPPENPSGGPSPSVPVGQPDLGVTLPETGGRSPIDVLLTAFALLVLGIAAQLVGRQRGSSRRPDRMATDTAAARPRTRSLR